MTKIGKVLVVFTALMSLVFLAFISVTTLGGPNWQMRAAELEDYSVTALPGETVTYEVSRKVASEERRRLTTAPTMPAAIVAAQNDKLQVQQEEQTRLDAEIAAVRTTLDQEKQAIGADEAGITARRQQLDNEIKQLDEQILALEQQGIEQSRTAEATRMEAEERRQDVARLTQELAQLRTDRYQIEEQQKQLQDMLTRLNGLVERAERRNQQLQERVPGTAPQPVATQK